MKKMLGAFVAAVVSAAAMAANTTVSTVEELYTALAAQKDGDVITLAAGTYDLTQQIVLTNCVTLTGAGRGQTILRRASSVKSMRIAYLDCTNAVLEKVTVRDGLLTSGERAAGVWVNKGIVRDCEVTKCGLTHWGTWGRGNCVSLSTADAKLYRSIIHGNSGSGFHSSGMAVFLEGGSLMESCLIYDNKNTDGNARYTVYVGNGTVRHCTIVDNATPKTCALYLDANTSRVYDCIVFGNSGSIKTTSNTLGNGFDISASTAQRLGYAYNCKTDEPYFMDSVARDYRLHPTSPCVDAGLYGDDVTTEKDLNGAVRIQGAAVDIGAYETTPTAAVMLKADTLLTAAGTVVTFTLRSVGVESPSYTVDFGDGTSETTSAATLTHIYSAAGSYTPSALAGELSYTMPNAIVIRPNQLYVKMNATGTAPYDSWDKAAGYLEDALAYAASGTTVWVEDGEYMFKNNEQISLNEAITVRSASDDPMKVTFKCKTANTHKMFRLNNTGAVLSGLTVTGGSHKSDYQSFLGADVYIEEAGGMVTNCILTGAVTSKWGNGGCALTMYGGVVTHTKIVNNSPSSSAGDDGGHYGAIIYMGGGRISNSIISGNTGGGLSTPTKGGVMAMSGNCTLENCVIANNKLSGCAGIILYNATPRIYNTIFAGNTSTGATGDFVGIYNKDSSASYADCFVNCAAEKLINDTCQASSDLGLSDLKNGDFHILGSSVCRNNGTTDGIAPEATDLDGNARIDERSGKIDIGAYEVHVTGLSTSITANPPQTEGLAPLTFTFTASVEGGTPTEYQWYVDDVCDESASGATYEKTFAEPGAHVVSLSVSDGSKTYEASNVIKVRAYPKTLYVLPFSPDHIAVAPYDSWEKAATNIADAIAAAYDGSEIIVGKGVHLAKSTIAITHATMLRGETGNPNDVVIRSATMYMADPSRAIGPLVSLNNASSLLSGVTIEGGCVKQSGSGGNVFIDTLGGSVSNVISRNTSRTVGWGGMGGGIYMRNGLVTHCIVSNCLASTYGSGTTFCGGSGALIKGGEIRETLFVKNGHEGRSDVPGKCGTVRIQGGKVVNCTISDNDACSCSGIYIDTAEALKATSTGEAINCIVSGNWLTYSNTTEQAWVSVPTNLASVAWGGETANFKKCLFDATELPNDTCLSEPATTTFRDWAHGRYLISADSLGIDASVERTDAPATDLRRRPRLFGDAIDLGCYEWQGGLMLLVR